MSVFLDILRCILCCGDNFHHGDYETSQRDPLFQSASYDISAWSNSASGYNHLPRQPDPKNFYYEFYPNLPTTSESTAKQPNDASLESKYNNKPLKRAGEVSQTLSSFSSSKHTPPSFDPSVSSSKPYSSFSSTTFSSKPLSSPPKASSSSIQSSSFSKPPSSSHKPSLSSTGAPPSSSNPSVSSSKTYSSFSNSISHSSRPLFSPPKASSSTTQLSSFSKPPLSSLKPSLSSTIVVPSSPTLTKPSITYTSASSSSAKSPSSSLGQSLSSPEAPPFTFDQPLTSAKPSACSLKQSPSLTKASPSSCDLSQSSSKLPPSSLMTTAPSKPTLSALPFDSRNQHTKDKRMWVPTELSRSSCDLSESSSNVPPSFLKTTPPFLKTTPPSKPTLSALPFDSINQHAKDKYMWVQKDTSPVYMIPKDIEDLFKKDILPNVLKKPLSPSTYKDYFAALLYSEDFYIEKWSKFELLGVTLKLHKIEIFNKASKNKNLKGNDEKQDKTFVAFEIDSVPERRPFFLARDFVHARRLGSTVKQFQGLIYRVVKSNFVLVEFEEDFYFQHHSDRKYDISFSFNRVCLKRAHQAIAAASGPLSHNYLFPDCASRKNDPVSPRYLYFSYELGSDQTSAVHQILNFQGSPPYLVEGPLSVTGKSIDSLVLSKTGVVVREAVLQIYRSSPRNRVLICAPINRTCDVLIRSLGEEIPESDMFRANAAFREVDGVPVDILPLCLYKGECFACPSVQKLRQFRVIFSTFVSSFRLHNEGITAGHFSHIFLVDASSATEPETMITLGNLANENTSVIVSGAPDNHSSWVRSDIARKKGLRISYFQRLRENKTYKSLEPMFITRLQT